MPWTIEEVEKHRKGLSEAEKKRWVRIANSALKICIAKGLSQEDCDATAIKQANSVLSDNSQYQYINNEKEKNYKISKKKYDGKEFLVVPVTMMVEGVHCGNHGPLLHTIEELGKFPDAWNGIPVVINHPEKQGEAVSANSPEVLEECAVGMVFNTHVKGRKLKAEAWLDPDKLSKVSQDTLMAINKTQEIEVSVGVFTEEEEEEGDYDGETYAAIAKNHRPDHLALLPNAIGACSLEDGCGIRANKRQDMDKIVIDFKAKGQDLLNVLRQVSQNGFMLSELNKNKEQGYQELMSMIWDKLSSLNSDKVYHYTEELYDDYLIYSKSGDNDRKLYKQAYKIESGKIEFVGEPVEVHKKVEYVVNQLSRTKFKGGKNMQNNAECAPCIKKRVDELIANSQGKYTEDDREMLQTLNETMLDKIAKPVEVIKEVEKKVEVNGLSEEDKAALTAYKKQLKDKREGLIKSIQDNTSKEQWPDAVLNEMKDDVLERVFNSTKKKEEVNDYSLNGGHTIDTNASGEEEFLLPVGIEISK